MQVPPLAPVLQHHKLCTGEKTVTQNGKEERRLGTYWVEVD